LLVGEISLQLTGNVKKIENEKIQFLI